MKKRIFFLFLFFISGQLFTEEMYFRSNEIGMLLEKIEWYRNDDFEYVIKRSRELQSEVKILLKNETEIKRWEITYYTNNTVAEEKEFEKGVLLSVFFYDARKRLTREQFFIEGDLSQSIEYFYKTMDLLDFTRTYDAEGNLLYQDNYALTGTGGLREINRVWQDEKYQKTAFIYGAGNLAQEAHSSDQESILFRYDQSGRLLEREVWRQGQIMEKQDYAYFADTEIISLLREEDFSGNSVYLKTYNRDGNLIQELRERDQKQVAIINYTWDERGNNIQAIEKSDKGQLIRKYYYNADDTLASEETFLRGVKESKIVYLPDESYYLERYNKQGEAVIRIYYREDEKFKEEILDKNRVIRTRTFE